MSKTIDPITYEFASAWVQDYFDRDKSFYISNILDRIPLTQYMQEENCEELIAYLSNYILDVVEIIAKDSNKDPHLCKDFSLK